MDSGIDYQRLKLDLLALGLLAVTLAVCAALVSFDPADSPSAIVWPTHEIPRNLCGPTGATLAYALRSGFGLAAWLIPLGLIAFDMRLFARKPVPDPGVRATGFLLVLTGSAIAFQLVLPTLDPQSTAGSGGFLGAWAALQLQAQFSVVGSLILAATLVVAGMLLATESVMVGMLRRCMSWTVHILLWPLYGRRKKEDEPTVETDSQQAEPESLREIPVKPKPPMASPIVPQVEDEPDSALEEPPPALLAAAAADKPAAQPSWKVNAPAQLSGVDDGEFESGDFQVSRTHYELPDLGLLENAEEFPFELLAKKAQVTAATLEQTFEQFGLNVKVSEIDTGPVVTQFELELEPGLRVSKVVNLQDDIAIALRVPSVRVVPSIPGKNTVGVEVPNDKRVMVRLRELIETCSVSADKMRVPLFLGKDVGGHPLAVDLTKMPHLLIAGRTGTGKSVCLNTLIASILMTRTPDDVRMLMIDPKMVELSPYKRIPHLMHPVITDMKQAEAVLAWAVEKMEERYDLLARCGVRHLDGYNKLGRAKALERMGLSPGDAEADDVPEHMPSIVIVADEMADMMMTSGKDVEGHIIRLAQKSRAVGIHLVLATQKPTVDVITGLIKSNLPARISFQVASRTDSRVVLDEGGADRLLGNGDMLYLAPGTSNLTRAQGTFVSDEEINDLIEFYSDYAPDYCDEIEAATTGSSKSESGSLDDLRERDELYTEAIDVVVREGRGSVSLLQRSLGIGYGRAARMVDYMAEDGIVGEYNGSKCREVIYTTEQWEAVKAGA